MKKKFVVALVAAMSLTVAGTGTVFAMDKVSTVASEKSMYMGITEWIVDKEAWTEEVVHPETKQEWVVTRGWTENILKYKCSIYNGCQANFHQTKNGQLMIKQQL